MKVDEETRNNYLNSRGLFLKFPSALYNIQYDATTPEYSAG
jgi:hypothetical protein